MSEYLEFKDKEMPEKNPNPKNDVYRISGTSDADGVLVGGIIFSVIFIAIGFFYGGDTLFVCMLVGIIFFGVCIALLYDKYCFRKKAIKEGVAYPAVIVQSFD